MSSALPRPAPCPLLYAQRRAPPDRPAQLATDWRRPAAIRNLTRAVGAEAGRYADMLDAEFHATAGRVRAALRRHGLGDAQVLPALALLRETASRALDRRPREVEVAAAYLLLNGVVAGLDSGEARALPVAMAAAIAALAGEPVHVVAATDHLAARDAERMRPLFACLGLSVGLVAPNLSLDQRRQAYHRDVTYAAARQLAFDYLRDRAVLGGGREAGLKLERLCRSGGRAERLSMRGLRFAILDAADTVLIDDARTPLIVSRETDAAAEAAWARQALELARPLTPGTDFMSGADGRTIELTGPGRERLAAAGALGDGWASRVRREDAVCTALAALHLLRPDEHYRVRDGRVELLDGALPLDPAGTGGLKQVLEAASDCAVTGRRVVVARISLQRFFRRYGMLAGLAGDLGGIARELRAVYGLPSATLPSRQPDRGRAPAWRCWRTADDQARRIVERVGLLRARGRAVLVLTRGAEAARRIAAGLGEAGVPARLVLAPQDATTAGAIAEAGQPGRVTVCESVAAIGIDLPDGDLHAILAEQHDRGRLDRRLAATLGRDRVESMLSLDDPLTRHAGFGAGLWRLAARLPGRLGQTAAARHLRRARRGAEALQRRMRREQMKLDDSLGTMLAFSGEPE